MGFITFGSIATLLLAIAAIVISLVALLKKSQQVTWEIPLGEFVGYLTREEMMDMDADLFILKIERKKVPEPIKSSEFPEAPFIPSQQPWPRPRDEDDEELSDYPYHLDKP